MASELKGAYLISGDDEAKISAAVERLRERAEREQGPGALERTPLRGNGAPDLEALAGGIATLSLTATHRYVLVEGAERIGAAEVREVAGLIGEAGEDVTVVFVAHGDAKAGLLKVIEAAEGAVLSYTAPKRRDLPRWVGEEARRRGIELAPAAAKALIDRAGGGTARLVSELDRLALWADPGQRLERDDVAASVADASEEVIWTLTDAIIERRPDVACRAAERLLEQGESTTPLIYATAKSLRRALQAVELLRAGRPRKQVAAELGGNPWATGKLIDRVSGSSPEDLQDALGRFAELEWETRGGSDRDERSAFVLAVRAAAGAAEPN